MIPLQNYLIVDPIENDGAMVVVTDNQYISKVEALPKDTEDWPIPPSIQVGSRILSTEIRHLVVDNKEVHIVRASDVVLVI